MNTQEFIEKAKRIHSDKYDYSKIKYVLDNNFFIEYDDEKED